ncbi:MAG: DUF1223 domain-containing protein [Pseudomonadota bacterium]|nr:DUF1223 domain-containing protein [Pseudomonadota bacterium]
MTDRIRPFTAAGLLAISVGAFAAGPTCRATSPATLTPVIELYTSEGCSSCPPADRWLSGLKATGASGSGAGQPVVQAFHVGYWDSLGWVDRFASAAHTERQKLVARNNGLPNIHTPQLVRNGRDWPDYSRPAPPSDAARANITVQRGAGDAFEASVAPADPAARWSAYWTVTEHGHASKVKAGENAGEFLQHDFVVRQYVPAGDYQGNEKLVFRAVPGEAGHARQVNLVVFDKGTGKPLQAISVAC